MDASCERMCVVEYRFVLREQVLDVFCRLGCCKFSFLNSNNCCVHLYMGNEVLQVGEGRIE